MKTKGEYAAVRQASGLDSDNNDKNHDDDINNDVWTDEEDHEEKPKSGHHRNNNKKKKKKKKKQKHGKATTNSNDNDEETNLGAKTTRTIPPPPPPPPPQGQRRFLVCDAKVLAFWCMGLLNNTGYDIMLAAAKSISEGGTALVFLANVVPSMCVKLTAPYWFHLVSYHYRIMLAAVCMSLSFWLVGLFRSSLPLQLVGVALGSFQSGLGEATLLSFSGKLSQGGDSTLLTAFSSGTGLAGVFGFAYVVCGTQWLRASLSATILSANLLALAYGLVFAVYLGRYEAVQDQDDDQDQDEVVEEESSDDKDKKNEKTNDTLTQTGLDSDSSSSSSSSLRGSTSPSSVEEEEENPPLLESSPLSPPSRLSLAPTASPWERLCRTLSLWPYMIPLFTVFAAEYALQSGTWTAIGFPIESESSRAQFYEFSNWMYQVGVFVSRSSGTVWRAKMWVLWLMPVLQCLLLVFFTYTALHGEEDCPWYHAPILLPLCGVVGLLGGSVYVQGYVRITADFKITHEREWALATVSVADSWGVAVADFGGLFLQACIYQHYDLPGAVVSCPLS